MTEPLTGEAKLSLVGTPIGNLGDISHRAEEVLGHAEVIACEDTRRTSQLLRHLGIDRPKLIVVNDHTERDAAQRVVDAALGGSRVALVSDAGMPAVSDPGYLVVLAAIEAGVTLDVVPGPSAVLAALVLSGLATDRFVFDGFLPRKGAERSVRLGEAAAEHRTVVLYEAPHRLERTLADLIERCGGERRIAVARELTKMYEQVWRGTASDALAWAREASPRGEIVIVIDGAPVPTLTDDDVRTTVASLLDSGMSVRDAADAAARDHRIRKRVAYQLALELSSD